MFCIRRISYVAAYTIALTCLLLAPSQSLHAQTRAADPAPRLVLFEAFLRPT